MLTPVSLAKSLTPESSKTAGEDALSAPQAQRDVESRLRLAQMSLLGPWALLMLCLCVALALWQVTAARIERENEMQFDTETEQVNRAVKGGVDHSVELLRGLQALFHASNAVNRKEFHDYLQTIDLRSNHRGVRAIQFARLVTQADKAAFEASVRSDNSLVARGYLDFAIKPEGDRPRYVVVEFNEPMAGNEAAFGHDQAHEASRRAAMERARDTGLPIASAPIQLLQSQASTPGFVIRMPVYGERHVPASIAARRETYVGQLSAVFVARDFFQARLPQELAHFLQITVDDVTATSAATNAGQPVPLYSWASDAGFNANLKSADEVVQRKLELSVAGRTWLVTVTKARQNAMYHPIALTVFSAGILIAVLVFVSVKTFAGRGERAAALAARMTIELRSSSARLKSVVDTTVDGIIVFDSSRKVESVNPAAARMLGYSESEVHGETFNALFALMDDEDQSHEGNHEGWYTGETGVTYQVRVTRKDGSAFPGELSLGEMHLDSGTQMTGVLRDVTERNAAQEKIRDAALHDPLTGLPNRSMLNAKLTHAIEHAIKAQHSVGTMFIDLDRFKWINDTLGHEVGDALLCEVAHRLSSCVRSGDTVARTGGDEFVIVMGAVRSAEECAAVARLILAAMSQPIRIEGHELLTSPSIGIALYPQDANTSVELMQRADAAMYLAKESGRNNFQVHSPTMSARAARRSALETALSSALSGGALEVYYQPIIELNEGKIVGAEAFLRLNHHEFGVVRADELVPIAEDTGLIVTLGEWVLESACHQAVRWFREMGRELQLAVNVSPRQFGDRSFPEVIERVLRTTGFKPGLLTLDVSEGIVTRNVGAARAQLNRLRNTGVRVAFDNFGTGSLGAELVQSVAFDAVKVDRGIVRQATVNANGIAVLSALVAMARDCGLTTYAEGVESPIQLEVLRETRCGFAQGYLIGAPMRAQEFTESTHVFELAA